MLVLTPAKTCATSTRYLSAVRRDSAVLKVLPTRPCNLQGKQRCCKTWAFRLAAVGRSVLLALFLESPGRSLMRNAASCKSEKLNQDLGATAYYEMLHRAGTELAFPVLHCRERRGWSKKQFSLTTDVNSTKLLYCEDILKNV